MPGRVELPNHEAKEKKLDLAKLHNDISECFSKIDLSTIPDINDLISKYNISLTEIYDVVAPIQSRWSLFKSIFSDNFLYSF